MRSLVVLRSAQDRGQDARHSPTKRGRGAPEWLPAPRSRQYQRRLLKLLDLPVSSGRAHVVRGGNIALMLLVSGTVLNYQLQEVRSGSAVQGVRYTEKDKSAL